MPRKKVFHDSSDEDDDGGFEILKIDKPKQPETLDDSDDVEDLLAESDSDSAPEDVDFLSSKSTALQQAKDATQQIGLEKAKQKDKRKKQDTLFKEQKKQKLEALEKNRLPDDILEDLAAKPPPSKVKKTSKPENESGGEYERLSGSDDEFELTKNVTEDFIPLSSEKEASIQAVCLYEQLRKPKSSAEKAAEFRQKALHRPRIQRESTRSMLARKKKKRPT